MKQNKIVPEKESKVVRMVRKIDEKEQKEKQKENVSSRQRKNEKEETSRNAEKEGRKKKYAKLLDASDRMECDKNIAGNIDSNPPLDNDWAVKKDFWEGKSGLRIARNPEEGSEGNQKRYGG